MHNAWKAAELMTKAKKCYLNLKINKSSVSCERRVSVEWR